MKILVTVVGVGDRSIEANTAAVVADLVSALGFDSSQSLLVRRTGQVLQRTRPLGFSDLRSGDTVEPVPADAPARRREHERPATLRVLSGPEEGKTFDLDHGETSLGRVASNDIVLMDVSLSRRHATLSVDTDGVTIADAGSTNGVLVDGKVITGPTLLGADQPVLMGQTWFVVDHHVGGSWAATGPEIRFQPSPRSVRQLRPQTITLPEPPGDPSQAGAAPADGGGADGDRSVAPFATALASAVTRLDGHLDAERMTRLFEAPSVAELSRAIKSRTRLWERAESDPLVVRLGRTEVPSLIEVAVPEGGDPDHRERMEELRAKYSMVNDAPATIDLGAVGGLELNGPADAAAELAAELIGQLAALHSPDHLALTAILAGAISEFDWMKWLPHARQQALTPEVTETGGSAMASGLLDRLSMNAGPSQRVVVVIDAGVLTSADLADLMHRGPEAGVHAIVMTGSGGSPLPVDEGRSWARVSIDDTGRHATVERGGGRDGSGAGSNGDRSVPLDQVVLERTDGRLLREIARLMSSVVDARFAPPPVEPVDQHQAGSGVLTTSLVAPLAVPDTGLTPEVVLSRWERSGETLGAPIGQGDGGQVTIDMAADTLISVFGGGFGHSDTGADEPGLRDAADLLRSMLLSLAATYPPEALNLVLVDGGDGSTFDEIVGLPHTVAVVTDLSESGIGRAVTSLEVEQQRRVAMLSNEEDHQGLDLRRRRLGQNMPDLLLVVAELAETLDAAPDFVAHLADLAHQGGDAGFRLLAASDRLDRLGPETLAKFSTRIVLGHQAVLQRDGEAQLGFRPVSVAAPAGVAPWLRVSSLDLGRSEVIGRSGPEDAGHPVETAEQLDLSAVVGLIGRAVGLRPEGLELRKPILPPLPTSVDLRKLPKPSDDSQFVVGIVDLPERQRRIVMAFNAARDRSLAILGASGTGKSTALRAVASSVALTQVAADRLPLIYGIDFGAGGLNAISELPHVATVATEPQRMMQILADMEHLFLGRRSSFGTVGASSLADYRSRQQHDVVRQVLVLIDDLGAFLRELAAVGDPRWVDLIRQILMFGGEVGLHFVLTARSADEIPPDLGSHVGRWMTMVGSADPDRPPPGRAVVSDNEVQIALLDGAAGPLAEAEAIGRLTRELLARGATPSPAM